MFARLHNKTHQETIELHDLDHKGRVRLPSHWSVVDDDYVILGDPDAHIYICPNKYQNKTDLHFFVGAQREFEKTVAIARERIRRLC